MAKRSLLLMPKAVEHLGWFIQHELKLVKKIYEVLDNCCDTPFTGVGQPEALKGNFSGYWSRRVNLEHRIVYKVVGDSIVVFQLKGHYE